MTDDVFLYFAQTILSHYNKYVEEKFNKRFGQNTDQDSALIIAGMLYHFRERLPKSWNISSKYLVSVQPDYELLGDIVNVSKHNSLDVRRPQYKIRSPLVLTAEDIKQVTLLIEYEDDKGVYYDHDKCVFATLNTGMQRDVYPILNNVLNMWINELNRRKVLNNMQAVPLKSIGVPPRMKDTGAGKLDLSVLQNAPMKSVFHMMKYNYQTGNLDPKTIEGKMSLTLYEIPQHDVEVTYKSKDGLVINKNMKIGDLDYQHLISLETSIEQQAFAISIIRKEGLIDEVRDELIKLKQLGGPNNEPST